MHDCDLLIQGAAIYDGTGSDPYVADVGIDTDRIAFISPDSKLKARRAIDANGLALAPGFIDVHTHDDRALLITDMSAKVSQGVTSVVVGNCGISLAPLVLSEAPPPPLDLIGGQPDFRYPQFADYLDELRRQGIAVNAACLVGHSTLRVGVVERLDREASPSELIQMRARLQDALDAGAVGFSTGLDYPPAAAAPTSEIKALAELLEPAGAIHTTHMRDESDGIAGAMDEAFEIGAHAGVPVVISHFKVAGKTNFGRSTETLAKFDRQRKLQPLALDAYPYAASSTILRSIWIDEAPRTLVTWSVPHPEHAGRDLSDIAEEWGVSIAEAADRLQPAGAVYFSMDEADVRRILSYPETMIGSDGLPHDRHPHPRLWGSFPRVLGHYSREIGLFPLKEAIRRMTSLPAKNFKLKDRGQIRQGWSADLTLFDPARVRDIATFAEPTKPAAGIHRVWVNGVEVWRDGRHTGERPGSVLRRNGT